MRLFYILIAAFLILSILPLFAKVGQNLEYEYSLIFSWLVLIIIPLGILFLPKRYLYDAHHKLLILDKPEWYAGLYIIICLVISLLIGWSQFLLGSCRCTPSEFWLWYGLNSIPAVILSLLLCLVLINWGVKYSRKKMIGLLSAFYLMSFLDLFFWLWFFPQKRISHFVFGFLHGPIYDRYIPVDMGIIFIRSAHLFLSLGLFFAIISAYYSKKKVLSLILLSCYFLSAWYSSQYSSVGHGAKRLKMVLPETYEEEGFLIHYVKGKNGKYLNAARNLVLESRFHLSELKEKLKLSKSSKVHIYAYPSSLTKKLAFGGGGTDVTDVFTPSIHISLTSQLYPSLRHELVHALGSDFGFFGLGFHPNMALTEGLAVALAPELRSLDIHEGAYEILKRNSFVSIEILFSPFFWMVAGPRSYTISGSLVSYLLAQFGAEGLKSLYSGQSFEQAFQMDSKKVFKNWFLYIKKISENKENSILAESIFRSPGALYEKCTHSKPVLRKKAKDGSFLKFRQPADWKVKRDYDPWFLSLDPDSKEARTRMLFREAQSFSKVIFGDSDRNVSQELKGLDKKIFTEIDRPFRYLEDSELQLLQSDLWFHLNRKNSIRILSELADELENKNFGEVISRKVFARVILEQGLNLENIRIWRRYLAGWGRLPKRAQHYHTALSEPWLLQYLRLRNQGDEDWKALNVNQRAFESEVPHEFPNTFKEQWFAYLAKNFLKHKDYKRAAKAWKKCSEYSKSGKIHRYLELSRMAEFFRKHEKNIVL
ncbi:MAG: hypothetical protein AB8G05_14490 [Oligoflexales bacterium]